MNEGETRTLMSRESINNVYITQAAIQSVTLYMYDLSADSPASLLVAFPVPVQDAVFDTLQTDAVWDVDALGYNFKHTISPSYFTRGAVKYRLEYILEHFDATVQGGEVSRHPILFLIDLARVYTGVLP
jgi:hypothetical protein